MKSYKDKTNFKLANYDYWQRYFSVKIDFVRAGNGKYFGRHYKTLTSNVH